MNIDVFDFFSGCGGTSSGLSAAGLNIKFALDSDSTAIETFKENFPKATTVVKDITDITPDFLDSLILPRKSPLLFCGCAPCQPFSKQNNNKSQNDPRRNLLTEFSRFVEHWMPEYILVENVPGLQKIKGKGPFNQFISKIRELGYNFDYSVLPACGFGVPQKRERLVLIASLLGSISLPKLTHGPTTNNDYSKVKDWISGLSKINAGETCKKDPDHQAAKLSTKNLERIRATPEGGGRDSWPKSLWLDCHKNYRGHTDVYGRLHWDKLASGLTTRCISLSNGRFGHPEQDRAISVREAACLQTFPRDYKFKGNLSSRARQIGNAVPPLMAKKIAEAILEHQKLVIRKQSI
ncbi:DNA cytosine methyltransferase [Microbulbifer sp. ANSA003]|uniref:DNA cytosine methyltransferase n=1 Tax=unclassified Microbulbifer TaxID=2619833 RepID=UPI0040390C21